jgi:hypothetical protein
MIRTLKLLTGAAVLGAITVACGGGSGSPAGPNPPGGGGPTPPPAKPTPAPTPDPRIGLPAGPVTRYTIKVRTVNNGEREPVQDAAGFYIVHPGERVDFDSTQKNAGGEICQWVTDPDWTIDGSACPMEANCGVIFRRGSSQPFLLKTTIQQLGTFTVQASIDGVISNILDVRSTPN